MICKQNAFDVEEPENVRRGKSVILWMKILLTFGIITGISSEYIIYATKPFLEMTKGTAPVEPPNLALVLAVFFFFILLVCLGIISIVIIYKACIWLYNTIKFLRKYTSTQFSPVGAVLCTMIPWVCGIIDYFIFKDILAQQKKILTGKNATFKPLDKKVLTAIPVLTTLLLIPSLLADISPARIANIVLIVFIAGAYIKTMETLVENEEALHAMREHEIVNRKVEEILKQRENS